MANDNEGESAQGFHHLWPTVMVQRIIPGHERANRLMAAYIEELDASSADLTTDYLGGNILVHDHPAMGWLRECINKTVIDYFKQLDMDYGIKWSLQGWANVNRLGDYHDVHNHPHSYLSGTYYVRVPDEQPSAGRRRDLRPGCITFYDPRGAVNMNAIKRDPYIEMERTVQPSDGMILLWPSFLHHFVHPNLGETPRISISFNAVLDWSNDYLPEQ